MPDGDIFTRTMARGWRVPARLTNAGTDSEGVARSVTRSLAQTLVEGGGCPMLRQIVTTIEETRQIIARTPMYASDPVAVTGFFDSANQRLSDLVAAADGHKHTQIAVDLARSVIVELIQMGHPLPDTAPSGTVIAERLCWRIVDHYHFDAQRPLLMGHRFSTFDEAQVWRAEVSAIMASRVTVIADNLERDPTGQTVRNPRWPRQMMSTAEVLASAVVLGPAGEEL